MARSRNIEGVIVATLLMLTTIVLAAGVEVFLWMSKCFRRGRVSHRTSALPNTRDVELLHESLEIIRRSNSLATVESRYEVMRTLGRSFQYSVAWSTAMYEASDKCRTLHAKQLELETKTAAEEDKKVDIAILEQVLPIVARAPGIVQTEVLSIIDGYARDQVRLALATASKDDGPLIRIKYRSTYKLYIR